MTDKQIQASRENGSKSRGPVTPEGKQNSSQNATKHGLCAKGILLPGESEEDLRKLEVRWMRNLRPPDGALRNIAEQLVAAAWQMERYRRIEASMLAAQMEEYGDDPLAAGRAFNHLATQTRSLDLLHRYATRARREFDRLLQYYRAEINRRDIQKNEDLAHGMTEAEHFRVWGTEADAHPVLYFEQQFDFLPNEPEPSAPPPLQAAY